MDVPGFCRAVPLDEVAAQGYVMTPGRYVGAAAPAAEAEEFDAQMLRLTAELSAQMARGAALDRSIRARLRGMGYVR